MTVHALQLYRFAVDVEVSAGQLKLVLLCFRLANLNGSDAEVGRCAVQQAAFLIFEFGHEDISVGALSTPRQWIRYVERGLRCCRFSSFHSLHVNAQLPDRLRGLVGIEQDGVDGVGHRQPFLCLFAEVVDLSIDLNDGLLLAELCGSHC